MVWVVAIAAVISTLTAVWLGLRLAAQTGAVQTIERTPALVPPADQPGVLEAALALEHEALLETCAAGVLVLGTSGLIESANRLAASVFGAVGPILPGRTVLESTLSNDMDQLVSSARQSGSPVYQEVVTPGGGGRALLVSVTPMRVPGQQNSRYIVVAQDVSELRRLERVRRDFVANVSHELRTPLASIRAMAETLRDGALEDPEVSDGFLLTIVNEAQRLTRIAEDLLILSRAESQAPEMRRLDLAAMISEIAARFKSQAREAGISLELECKDGLEVIASRDQLEQVVLNLLDNAIKYTSPGGHVEVRAYQSGSSVALQVTDTGIGIMTKDLSRIFERFYRVDKARSRQSGGTGLGLSIVKHIVESHGGQVVVDSRFNEGTTFTVTLPGVDVVPLAQAS